MADTKIDDSGVSTSVAAVTSITEATPAEADKTSVPNALDAQNNEPPVRTNRPDVPVAQVLAAGAGKHEPREFNKDGVDKDGLDGDGRPVGDPPKKAAAKS